MQVKLKTGLVSSRGFRRLNIIIGLFALHSCSSAGDYLTVVYFIFKSI